jgi:hypothetical protein
VDQWKSLIVLIFQIVSCFGSFFSATFFIQIKNNPRFCQLLFKLTNCENKKKGVLQ